MDCKHHFRAGLSIGLICLAVATAGAQAEKPAALMQRVQLWLDGTRDLQGRFEQSLVSGALGTGLTESGEFFLERPGRMRWNYLAPEKKVALVLGSRTWFYIEEDEQLMRGRVDGSELLLRLLTGDTPLAELFDVAPVEPGAPYRLTLTPRGDEMESFQQLVLSVSVEDAAINAAEVVDVAGNRVVYRFRELRRNAGLRPGIFNFEPPAGTMILGEQ